MLGFTRGPDNMGAWTKHQFLLSYQRFRPTRSTQPTAKFSF